MSTNDKEYTHEGEIVSPSERAPTVNEYAPATVSDMLQTAFWYNVRFRMAQRMFTTRRSAIEAHTMMMQAETANYDALAEHRRAWERLDKDLDATLENDRIIAEAKRNEERTNALIAAMEAEDALETFKATRAAKEARGKPEAAGPRSYDDRFKRHFSARAQIYAARDEAIRAIIEREKTQGRDESHPDVQAQIGEAQQYTEELISKLRDAE